MAHGITQTTSVGADTDTLPQEVGADLTLNQAINTKSEKPLTAQRTRKRPLPTRQKEKLTISPGEVPSDQVVHLTMLAPHEETYDVPTVRVLFSAPEEVQNIARLALALDGIGAAALPFLVDGSDEECAGLGEGLDLLNALAQIAGLPGIKTFTIGGSAAAVIDLAAGEIEQPNGDEAEHQPNNTFMTALAARHYIDLATIQSLREVRSSDELLQLLNQRRLGWLFDEVCRLACLEVRKRFPRPAKLETIAFGNTGALLGRAVIEPGTFEL